jgi:hypothetical protein
LRSSQSKLSFMIHEAYTKYGSIAI